MVAQAPTIVHGDFLQSVIAGGEYHGWRRVIASRPFVKRIRGILKNAMDADLRVS